MCPKTLGHHCNNLKLFSSLITSLPQMDTSFMLFVALVLFFFAGVILDGNEEAAKSLAEVIHSDISVEADTKLQSLNTTIPLENTGIWIDPIGKPINAALLGCCMLYYWNLVSCMGACFSIWWRKSVSQM